ncbi:MAG: PbsX family transcriptional regulator [Sideroxydans sp.]|nr:PbsX family transcriptional regulator [Sideroxydans sp.]
MSEVMLDIKQWGNSLGMRLPAAIAREAHLQLHQRVCLSIKKGVITITPVSDGELTLAQRLANFDPVKHGGEAMQNSANIGAEKW